jgi:alkaline phosphatase
MDLMPVAGYAKTHSASSLVTDSAAAATAIATGVKTYNGAIGVDADGDPVETILERAQTLGKATGLVTTVQLAHATPAAFAAHVSSRNMMTKIAKQMLDRGVDVLLGGGEDEWLPTDETGCYPQAGERGDGLNLIQNAIAAGYAYVCTGAQFDAIDPLATSKLLGLFADEGMVRPYDPSLAEMTQKAIDILSQDPDGFFLMVEGGQIDWASHGNDAADAIGDTIGFDEAVAVARQFAATHPDTLVIVTADHETGGMSLEGAGEGVETFTTPDGQQFDIQWTSTYHTAVDVPVRAEGPHAWALSGVYENTHIFDVMAAAFQLPLCRTVGDFNDDGVINAVDIQWVAANWHRACSRW